MGGAVALVHEAWNSRYEQANNPRRRPCRRRGSSRWPCRPRSRPWRPCRRRGSNRWPSRPRSRFGRLCRRSGSSPWPRRRRSRPRPRRRKAWAGSWGPPRARRRLRGRGKGRPVRSAKRRPGRPSPRGGWGRRTRRGRGPQKNRRQEREGRFSWFPIVLQGGTAQEGPRTQNAAEKDPGPCRSLGNISCQKNRPCLVIIHVFKVFC